MSHSRTLHISTIHIQVVPIAMVAFILCLCCMMQPAWGVTVCFDWVICQVTGKDVNQQTAASVRNVCKEKGYKRVMVCVGTPKMEFQERNWAAEGGLAEDKIAIVWDVMVGNTAGLKKGDVILIGNDHTGLVGDDQGHIVHFLQSTKFTEQGVAMSPADAEKSKSFHPLAEGWTMEQFYAIERQRPDGKFQIPYLRQLTEVWRKDGTAGPGTGGSTPPAGTRGFSVRPGDWTKTQIQLKKGESVEITVKGQIQSVDGNTTILPDGYYHLGFRAWTFKAKVGKQLITIGSSGTVYAQEDGELLLAPSYTYEPQKDDEKLTGSYTALVTGAMIPPGADPGLPGGGAGGAGGTGGGLPPVLKGNDSPLAFYIGCPIRVEVKDQSGRRDYWDENGVMMHEISNSLVAPWDDGAEGYQWSGRLPAGRYALTLTGTGQGKFRLMFRQNGREPMAYPQIDVSKGQIFTLDVSDSGEAEPVLRSAGMEVKPSKYREDGSASPVAGAFVPTVVRTMTHHQITALERGVSGAFFPALSDQGNRVAFASVPQTDEPAHVRAVDFDGKNLKDLDTFAADVCDISGDGSLVVYSHSRELRIADMNGGRRVLVALDEPVMVGTRIASNGQGVFFIISRDCSVLGPDGKRASVATRGLYRIDASGANLKKLAGPEEIAALRGAQAADTGPNFRTAGGRASLEVSADGSRLAFGSRVKDNFVIYGCDGNGGSLHVITTTDRTLTSLGLSGDGSKVGFHIINPDEIGVVGFDGTGRMVLLAGPQPAYSYGYDDPVYLTYDGSRLMRTGRVFYTDSSAQFQVMASSGGELLRYSEYERPAMDASGMRFVYWPNSLPTPGMQLAAMELNVPLDRTSPAPRLTQLLVEPPALARFLKEPRPIIQIQARVTPADGQTLKAVSSTVMRNGIWDPQSSRSPLLDDGRAAGDGRSGDLSKGDGIFTSVYTYVEKESPDGPRSIRIDAQSVGADKLMHGQVIELGFYPLVDQVPPDAKSQPIDPVPPQQSKPPPPPTGPGGGPGTGTPPSGPGPEQPGPLDLTGLWRDDNGVTYSIRQMANRVYWSMDGRPRVLNVFSGELSQTTVQGQWVDLPDGRIQGNGSLTLRVESADRMVKTAQEGDYGATTWTRLTRGFGTETPQNPPGNSPPAGPQPPQAPGTQLPPANWPLSDPRLLGIMDQWLAQAKPPQQQDENLRYEEWGRLVGTSRSAKVTVNGPPDTKLSRAEYLWGRAAELRSTNLGTLREYVVAKLKT